MSLAMILFLMLSISDVYFDPTVHVNKGCAIAQLLVVR